MIFILLKALLLLLLQDDDDQYQASYDVGSFPKDFGYAPFDGETEGSMDPLAGEQKPRILLMGLRRQLSTLVYFYFDNINYFIANVVINCIK